MRAALLLAVLLATPAFAIVGGEADSGDDAVVALSWSGFTLCTGVLVSENAVLTAGHCLPPLGSMTILFGSDVDHPKRKVEIEDQLTHPQFTAEGAPYDFALIRLKTPVTDVAPLALGDAAMSDADVGAEVRHVGFGVSDEAAGSGAGVKRTVSYPITRVTEATFYSGAAGKQTCSYDSGAPALRGEKLIGIVSDGPDCHTDGWDGRVDVVAQWVKDTAAGWAPKSDPAPQKQGCAAAPGVPLIALTVLGFLRRRRAR